MTVAFGDLADSNLATNLEGGTQAHASDTSATVTITEGSVVTFGAAAYTAGEAAGSRTATVKVNASPAPEADLTVAYTDSGGTAVSGTDYTALSGSVTIAKGATSADITVTVTDDNAVEGRETIELALSSTATDYAVGSTASTTVTIEDDDPGLVLSSPTPTVAEGGTFTYQVSLSTAPHQRRGRDRLGPGRQRPLRRHRRHAGGRPGHAHLHRRPTGMSPRP